MNRLRALAGLLLVVPVLAGLSSCSTATHSGLTVVTSFYPLQFLAQRIAGGHARVENLTQPGKEPHDLELTVQQTADLAEADVAVYESGLQQAVDDAVSTVQPRRAVDATKAAGLVQGDPHFWFDPTRMARVADAVAAQLSAADPKHRSDYQANLATLDRQLSALDRAFRTGLAHCRVTTVVVSHEAFGYLTRYGVHPVPIVGLSPDAEPSPAHLASVEQLARKAGVTTAFYEPLASPATVRTVAEDLGLRTAVLDPIEGLTSATAHQNYLSLMRADLGALRTAGGCR